MSRMASGVNEARRSMRPSGLNELVVALHTGLAIQEQRAAAFQVEKCRRRHQVAQLGVPVVRESKSGYCIR
jgi:type IV secretory pathway TrbL component